MEYTVFSEDGLTRIYCVAVFPTCANVERGCVVGCDSQSEHTKLFVLASATRRMLTVESDEREPEITRADLVCLRSGFALSDSV